MKNTVVIYELDGCEHCGRVVHDNANTVRVWYDGRIITRHKTRHLVRPAPLLDPWYGTYWDNPKRGRKAVDSE